jgi:16S rRNA G1207 methylase RsmC
MSTLIRSVVTQLQKERHRLEQELRRVTAALTAFGKVYLHGKAKANPVTRKKRTISAAGRKRIAAAQKARWAKFKAAKKTKRGKG